MAVFWLCPGHVLAMFWPCLVVFWPNMLTPTGHSGYVLAMFWLCSGDALAMFWPCSGRVLAMIWLCPSNVLATGGVFRIGDLAQSHLSDLGI